MMMSEQATYGEWVRDLRVNGLHQTQEELGEMVGVHSVTVARWERGASTPWPFIQRELLKRAEELNFRLPPIISRRQGPRS